MDWLLKRDPRGWAPENPDEDDVQKVLDYMSRVEASKYAIDPLNKQKIYFTADPKYVSSAKYPEPAGYQVYSADISYMPLAYGGMEDEYESRMKWYYDLPRDHKALWTDDD